MILRKLRVLLAWDLILSGAAAIVLWVALPAEVANAFAKDIYELAATVLAVVFSVFVAALAIVMSAGDRGFAKFVAEEGSLEVIVFGFKWTLGLLFAGLLAAVFLYGVTSWWATNEVDSQPRWILAALSFLLLYGISATLSVAFAAVRHSQLHVAYLRLAEKNREELEGL